MKKLLIIPFLLLTINLSADSQTSRIDKNLTIYTDVMRQLDINYVDTLNYDDLIESSINQMLRKVDPYTMYIPKSEDDELRRMTQGKYGGVGALIMYRDSNVYVNELYEEIIYKYAGTTICICDSFLMGEFLLDMWWGMNTRLNYKSYVCEQ